MEQNETSEMWTRGLPQYLLMGFGRADEKSHCWVWQNVNKSVSLVCEKDKTGGVLDDLLGSKASREKLS